MRKFLFSGALWSAVLSGWSTLRTTRTGTRDWRLALLWISWAATVAIAVGSVLEKSGKVDELEE